MDTSKLKKFAQQARRLLMEQVAAKLALVTAPDSLARRESANAIQKLEEQIAARGEAQVIEQVAYTWFNRFCALRFMDVKRYGRIGVLSPLAGQFQPEILAEAKGGYVDEDVVKGPVRKQIFALVDGTAPSVDAQAEAYRLLIVAVCNDYHRIMPYLFERIDDYTELLMPDDLLSGNSIVAYTREAMTPDACEDVEVIGWLYQFYISEKKDDVFAALKKGKKITPENIPAATQLFTPHWIVRYLVENSLGRLWMLNHPDSRLVEQMDYYIRPEEPETDFLQISSPEEIKICDPACGSGHMLTYAFDLLYAIYEEQGYQATDIPRQILTHNLYGIEIDQRAGALAAFALTMKAREKYRRFLTGGKVVQPNICVLENIQVAPEDLSAYMDKLGRDLFSGSLQGVVSQWEEANNFGSLIRPVVTDVSEMLELLRKRQMGEDLFLQNTHQKVLKALRQADYLSPKYHVVVANPPYLSNKGMNPRTKSYAANNFPNTKSDLFAMFFERIPELFLTSTPGGYAGMMMPFTWMFLSTHEKLRRNILNSNTILSLVKPSITAFFQSAIVSVCAFVMKGGRDENLVATYLDLGHLGNAGEQIERFFEAQKDRGSDRWHFAKSLELEQIPGIPIAYSASPKLRSAFQDCVSLNDVGKATLGMNSTDNDLFVRFWWEVSFSTICFTAANEETSACENKQWYPYNKGGSFRKWYGNRECVINWRDNGRDIHLHNDIPMSHRGAPVRSKQYQFHESATWSFVSSSYFGVRYSPSGSMFDVGGSSYFAKSVNIETVVAFLCSKVAFRLLNVLNPTLNFQVGNVGALPLVIPKDGDVSDLSQQVIEKHKKD